MEVRFSQRRFPDVPRVSIGRPRVGSAQQGCGNVLCKNQNDPTLHVGTSISGEGGKWIDRPDSDLHFETPRF